MFGYYYEELKVIPTSSNIVVFITDLKIIFLNYGSWNACGVIKTNKGRTKTTQNVTNTLSLNTTYLLSDGQLYVQYLNW